MGDQLGIGQAAPVATTTQVPRKRAEAQELEQKASVPEDSFHRSQGVGSEMKKGARQAMVKVDEKLGPYGFGVADPMIRPVAKLYAAIIGGVAGLGRSLFGSQ